MHGPELRAGGDAAVVVKRAEGAAVPDLRREADRLRAAAHPGVVAIARSTGDEQGWELHLAHGGRPVASLPVLAPDQVAGIVAAAASTVADLHAAGIVHGHLSPEHILLGEAGRVRLCGLGPDAGGADPAADVAALGAVLVRLLGDREEMEPVPERRWRRPAWSGWARRSLLTIADQATADPASRRPTARRLAAAITAAVPGAEVPGAVDGVPRHVAVAVPALRPGAMSTVEREPRAMRHARTRLPALLGALAGVVVLGVGAIEVAAPGGGGPAAPGAALPRPTPVSPCEGDATACDPAIDVDGRVVTIEDRRFEVGRPGDRVVVGHWQCRGIATAAVLRPSTGEVFVFDRWADTGPLETSATTVVAGARELVVVGGPEPRCAQLVVRDEHGTTVPVDLEVRP